MDYGPGEQYSIIKPFSYIKFQVYFIALSYQLIRSPEMSKADFKAIVLKVHSDILNSTFI